MRSLFHGILLDSSKCVGCTNCIKKCPMEAIRVKKGISFTMEKKCINCGQCIIACPHHARSGITQSLESIYQYSYKIALIDPVLYAQFNENYSPYKIITSIINCGFDDVFEISRGADIITDFTRQYLKKQNKRPVIASSCPTIVRLIQTRFPSLIEHILPIDSPIEISAYMARKRTSTQLKIDPVDIGVFFVSSCPARIYSIHKPVGIKNSHVSNTLSIKTLFLEISKNIGKADERIGKRLFYSSGKAIGWARAGGQSQSLGLKEYLAVDGIANVINVLEEIENQKISGLSFIECTACTNGCVGGSLNVENSFVARNRVRRLSEHYYSTYPPNYPTSLIENFLLTEPIKPIASIPLDPDIRKAIKMLEEIKNTLRCLPNIDCGACGAPSCRALAEDIVSGTASIEDCIVILKNKLNLLY